MSFFINFFKHAKHSSIVKTIKNILNNTFLTKIKFKKSKTLKFFFSRGKHYKPTTEETKVKSSKLVKEFLRKPVHYIFLLLFIQSFFTVIVKLIFQSELDVVRLLIFTMVFLVLSFIKTPWSKLKKARILRWKLTN
jgi:hypothetical protein